MTITRTSEIKAAIHRICERHQISQENLAYDLGISHATLKNWNKGRRCCPKTALMALEALANKPLHLTGSSVLQFLRSKLTGSQERALCAAWHVVRGDDYELFDCIKDWSIDDKIEIICERYYIAPKWFSELIHEFLIDGKIYNELDFELEDFMFRALVAQARAEVLPVVARELAELYVETHQESQ